MSEAKKSGSRKDPSGKALKKLQIQMSGCRKELSGKVADLQKQLVNNSSGKWRNGKWKITVAQREMHTNGWIMGGWLGKRKTAKRKVPSTMRTATTRAQQRELQWGAH